MLFSLLKMLASIFAAVGAIIVILLALYVTEDMDQVAAEAEAEVPTTQQVGIADCPSGYRCEIEYCEQDSSKGVVRCILTITKLGISI